MKPYEILQYYPYQLAMSDFFHQQYLHFCQNLSLPFLEPPWGIWGLDPCISFHKRPIPGAKMDQNLRPSGRAEAQTRCPSYTQGWISPSQQPRPWQRRGFSRKRWVSKMPRVFSCFSSSGEKKQQTNPYKSLFFRRFCSMFQIMSPDFKPKLVDLTKAKPKKTPLLLRRFRMTIHKESLQKTMCQLGIGAPCDSFSHTMVQSQN